MIAQEIRVTRNQILGSEQTFGNVVKETDNAQARLDMTLQMVAVREAIVKALKREVELLERAGDK